MTKQTSMHKLPEDWKVVILGDEDITDLIMGQSPPSSTYNKDGIGLPFLQGNAEFGEIYPTPIYSCSQPIKIAEKNDILLSVRAPVGEININPFKSCIGRGLAAIRPKEDNLDYLFLYFYLKFGTKKLQSVSMGSTFKAVRKTEVEKFNVPLPPLPEQRRIAEILSTVDDAIQKVGEAIAKTERLKQGLMQELLTKGIGHDRFKDSKVGSIPEEWDVVGLGDTTKVTVGYVGPISEHYTNRSDGIPLLSTTNISENGIKLDTLKYVTPEFYSRNKKSQVSPGDIIIARHGISGSAAVIPDILKDAQCLNVVIVRQSEKFKSKFIEHLFNFKPVRNRLIGWKSGSVQGVVNTKVLEKFKIPLPPLPEQRKIASILSTVDKKLELERKRKEKLEKIKRGLMNDLLTGEKRVKI